MLASGRFKTDAPKADAAIQARLEGYPGAQAAVFYTSPRQLPFNSIRCGVLSCACTVEQRTARIGTRLHVILWPLFSRPECPLSDALSCMSLFSRPGRALAWGCHRAKATLPLPLAAALRTDPQLISAAVEAFYYRDADDMKAAARMATFDSSVPRVTTIVATNRCQFAQLAGQRFEPPRGQGWRLPPPGHPLAGAGERGLKITAGWVSCAHHLHIFYLLCLHVISQARAYVHSILPFV